MNEYNFLDMSISKAELEVLNDAINKEEEIYDQVSISSLLINHAYLMKNISICNTKYGKAVLVVIFDDINNITVKSWLPKKVSDHLTENIVKQLGSSDSQYTITYLGQSIPLFHNAKTHSLISFDVIE